MEMRDEVLSSEGAQDLDSSSYQISDLEDIEFNWEKSHLDMDTVFRLGIDNPFPPTTFDNLSMRAGSIENPFVLDEQQDKGSSSPLSSESHKTSQAKETSPLWTRRKNVPDYVFRKLFH